MMLVRTRTMMTMRRKRLRIRLMIVNHLALVMLGLLQGNRQTMGGEPIGKRILCSLQCDPWSIGEDADL